MELHSFSKGESSSLVTHQLNEITFFYASIFMDEHELQIHLGNTRLEKEIVSRIGRNVLKRYSFFRHKVGNDIDRERKASTKLPE